MERPTSSNIETNPGSARAFRGYAPPTSSTTYTPNQFFDVVLPRSSRGCLRLVAYVIRKTLGWSDEHGNPQNPEAHVSYLELIEKAGISRGALKPAIEEALSKKYLDCLRFGQPHRPGEEGFSALYSLRWDDTESYITDPEHFNGFFAGNGNLTHIPNDFFDYTIPNESLAVVKVVGVIIRNTIGYQTKFGFRRQQVSMSFSEIMRRTSILSRKTLHFALIDAIARNHVRKVTQGVFHPHNPSASVYSVRWEDEPENLPEAAVIELKSRDGSKREPGGRFKKETSSQATVQKGNQANGSEREPGIGSEKKPETVQEGNQQAFKKQTTIKTTLINNIPKQQQQSLFEESAAAVQSGEMLSLRMLLEQGFDIEAATMLASRFPHDRIAMQVRAVSLRKATKNRLGLLRKAIEENWPEPEAGVQTSEQSPRGRQFASCFYAALAGRDGDPTVSPSQTEADQAEDYLKRMDSQLGRASDPADTGRNFGAFVRKQQDPNRSPLRTLALALRAFGDTFFASMEEERRRAKRADYDLAKSAHEKAHAESYVDYQRSLYEKACEEEPELIEAFQARFNQRLLRMKQMSPRIVTSLTERYEDPRERAIMFAEYLGDERQGAVLGFWEWDQTINPDRFIIEEVRP